MKALFYIVIISIMTFSGCTKSGSGIATPGEWQLVKKYSVIGAYGQVFTPSWDSSVILQLNADSSYISELNYKVISKGSYSITTDTYNDQVLELNNFNTTGIFALFTTIQLGTNGQVLSVSNGFFMNIHADTLTLQGPPTPGGSVSYTFIKK